MDPLHRIEPSLFNTPMFYGSAGEPSLTALPNVQDPPMMGGMNPMSGLSPLFFGPLALSLMYPKSVHDQPLKSMLQNYSAQSLPEIDGDALVSRFLKGPKHPLSMDEMSFGKAFQLARTLKLRTFDWRGKAYTTELK